MNRGRYEMDTSDRIEFDDRHGGSRSILVDGSHGRSVGHVGNWDTRCGCSVGGDNVE